MSTVLAYLGRGICPYVKSPVASLCFACSSVRNLVKVTMSVLICSFWTPLPLPLLVELDMLYYERRYVLGKEGRVG